jgi:competence protein ComEA
MRLSPRFLTGFLACAALLQAELPPGPGSQETNRLCGKCHSPEQAASIHQSRTAWEETLAKMVSLGAEGSDQEFEAVLNYLTKNFGPETPRTVNVNKANAVELESAFGLTKSESAAVVQYRTEKGDFKSVDDLKNVPGLDFKKVEAKKARVSF